MREQKFDAAFGNFFIINQCFQIIQQKLPITFSLELGKLKNHMRIYRSTDSIVQAFKKKCLTGYIIPLSRPQLLLLLEGPESDIKCKHSAGQQRNMPPLHRKKRFTSFPSPAGMSLTKLPLGRNNSVMTSLFPPRESLVVTSRLGTANSRTFFYGVLIPLMTGIQNGWIRREIITVRGQSYVSRLPKY